MKGKEFTWLKWKYSPTKVIYAFRTCKRIWEELEGNKYIKASVQWKVKMNHIVMYNEPLL